MTQKHETTSDEKTSRRDFLRALYSLAPDDLYLELRCIHPDTGEVRTLWGRVSDKPGLAAVFKQADELNAAGYGVYFAPCLRAEKKGNADTAAWVPALWIDIDSTDPRDLEKLKAFDPAPSFIISSGSSWHAYWLLNEPFLLEADEYRQQIAAVLRGLFAALGGDPGYVKSMASVMRLPGSVNTKLECGGVVEIVDSQPERRHPLSNFAWLECQLQVKQIDGLEVVTLNGNGHHPLPPRTEQYLASGTANGSRNAELFAAACQLRDAGYSQSDAERDLVTRHIADGDGSENPAAREKEARATVASAYRQSPREPVAAPKEYARQVVGWLVGRFEAEQKTDRPTTQQIVEAKEKKRELDRLRQQEYVETESYVLLDGRMIYRKESYRGTLERTVADWSGTALYQTCQVDDNGREMHVTTIELQRGTSAKKLEVPGEIFVDDVALRRFIGANAGAQYVVRAGMSKHLVPAIVQLSGGFPTHRHYNFMGWMQLDGTWVYVSPGDCITTQGKLTEPLSVELDQRLHDYGLQAAGWSKGLAAFNAVTKVMPPQLAPALIAFALLPVLQRFFPTTATRPAVHLVGTSGSGKSEIASLLSSFYGNFSRDTPPAQWGDTVNTVETLGYPLADTLFWVDDYKSIYADEKTFTRFLQSYSRGMGRGWLTREAKVRQEKPCRGLILSTGETTIEGEMSVIARMLVLEVPPWEKRDPDGQADRPCRGAARQSACFTTHFATWVARQLEDGDLKEDIANRFSQNVKGYKAKLAAEIGRQSNNDRVVKNWAVLVTVYQLLSKFLCEMDEDYLLPAWQDVIVESVRTFRQERASEHFLNVLGQLIGSGQAVLDEDMRNSREYPPGVTVVGYRDEGSVYLLSDVALREVNKIQSLKFTAYAIGSQLREDGLLIPGKTNLSVQKNVRGSVVRLWRLKSGNLGCEDCEPREGDG